MPQLEFHLPHVIVNKQLMPLEKIVFLVAKIVILVLPADVPYAIQDTIDNKTFVLIPVLMAIIKM